MNVSPFSMVARFMPSQGLALRISGCLAGFLLLSAAIFSQSNTGRILGSVHDQQDAAIVGARVIITDVQRGVSRTLATDESGEYVAPDLTPGEYKIHVEAAGFNSVERQNIVLEVAKDARLDFTLKPGDSTQVVTVTGQVALIDTTSATLGGTLSNHEINDLPLNGRNYENLLQLRPGVVRYPGGGFSTTSTNGLRAEDNAYIIDGLFNSEPFSGQNIINGAGIAGDSATILPVDAIQEFNLMENPPAEYGWKPGAIVNVAVKSGTNELHGSAYGFYRDTIFDARNFFNPAGSPKTPRSLKQFGATVGGPIVKDKLFFFGGYEGQRYRVGNSGVEASPSTSATSFGDPTNSILDAISGVLATPGLTVSQVSLALAGCQIVSAVPPVTVTCNGKGFPTNPNLAGTLNIGYPNTVNGDNAIGKIDYHINDRHSLSGLYFFGQNAGTVDDAGELQPIWLTAIHTRAQVVDANWTWIPSARWVNEARFGYNRLYQPTFTADHNQSAASLGLNTGVTNPLYGGLPIITILPFNVPETLGGFVWPKVQGPDTRVQFVDHISYTFGRHALKFGGEIHRDSFSGGAYAGGRGRVKFLGCQAFAGTGFCNGGASGTTPLEDFFAGAPAIAQVLIGDPTRYIHNWSYAGFLQDDWRVTSRLTVNLGLRYELSTIVKEEHNLLGNFDPRVGDIQVGGKIGSPFNGDHDNFAPRLGVAWDPTGSGKTSIRAGGGLTYEVVNWEAYLAFNNTLGLPSIPTATSTGALPGGGTIAVGNTTVFFPDLATSKQAWNSGPLFPVSTGSVNCDPAAGGNPCAILSVDRNLVTPYVYNWTLSVQHAFTNNLSLEVAYVGDHGSKLTGIRDINQDVVANDNGDEQSGRPFTHNCPAAPCFPFLSAVYQMGNIYKSNYNGLQMTLTGRNYRGLSFVAGYTYAHALDDVGANWDFGAGLGLPQDSTHPEREYASSDFDIRHRFTLSTNYAIPGRKSFAQLLEGWELNSIVSLYSSQPWGPMDAGTDVSHTGASRVVSTGIERWDFFGNAGDFKSGPSPIPFFAFGDPNMPAACLTNAASIGSTSSLMAFGCYAKGSSVMIPPAFGTFGTMRRNMFRDSGFRNWDFSIAKNFKFKERLTTQFRAEFFNLLNHPNFANPFGGQNGLAFNDPSSPGTFGCGCKTPDGAGANPVIGSGGSRAIQFALKLSF
jgi:Carboxypeptidase regulatory-like domain/TonB dependent receptor